MIPPKEKAKELIDKFMSIDNDSEIFDGFKMGFFYAQRCALIAVDEILSQFTWKPSTGSAYWEQVKQEIEKL
jgi:hypothetical protein